MSDVYLFTLKYVSNGYSNDSNNSCAYKNIVNTITIVIVIDHVSIV